MQYIAKPTMFLWPFTHVPAVTGGGATQLIMPYLYEGILKTGQTEFAAWRWSYFFPGGMHVLCAALVLFCAVVRA